MELNRRSTDGPQPFRFMQWARNNLALAAAACAFIGAVLGGTVTVTVWYDNVSGAPAKIAILEPKVALLRTDLDRAEADIKRLQDNIVSADKRMNDQRAALDETQKSALAARMELERTLAVSELGRAVLAERVRGLENNSTPRPFAPGPRDRR